MRIVNSLWCQWRVAHMEKSQLQVSGVTSRKLALLVMQ